MQEAGGLFWALEVELARGFLWAFPAATGPPWTLSEVRCEHISFKRLKLPGGGKA